ncbi:jordan transposition protein [Dorcoceras hygrometricum]|uniref:Jordan transposition protein n=1 Tax=Dorcoceras hygrometricum TaxID=472368 RepID=A0A2Z7D8L8_9LAMI|nr:jordan transposition protein [Dorcoceras hygrometricum]
MRHHRTTTPASGAAMRVHWPASSAQQRNDCAGQRPVKRDNRACIARGGAPPCDSPWRNPAADSRAYIPGRLLNQCARRATTCDNSCEEAPNGFRPCAAARACARACVAPPHAAVAWPLVQ